MTLVPRRPKDKGRASGSTSGMALVMALAALAMMMILLVALFAGTSHQMRGAQGDASIARERMLADSAVALVIGQIQQATASTNQAWISQPGLLRTYAASATRTPTACYKLYSTATTNSMIDSSGSLAFMAEDVPANWSSETNQYTDLNAPVKTASGPIYPILDPAATNNVPGVSSDSGAVTMPVAWLYELQDGTLGPASNGTAANPIVARIAFWTDDESCKINVNTAGCGSPWNTPRLNSTNDVAWSSNQPAAGEYSAYPGHPATTSLAEALRTNSYSPQQLLALTPRYAWGGSQFGTQTTTPGESVPWKMDRLYASLDELCFSTNVTSSGQRQTNSVSAAQLETARFVLTSHSQSPETTLLSEPRIAIWPVADSTSTTAPRMTAADCAITNVATVGAGTATVGSYFFQRNNPLNPKDDFDPNGTSFACTNNLRIFNDLVNRGNLSLPGYGTTFAAKYPGTAWTQIMLEIVDFIHGINAVDPSPSPFVPFAGNSASTGFGYGFVDPLMTTYGNGASAITLRGMGRCPTLSSLTLVFYVSGFGFKNGTYIDYEETPDDSSGSNWKNNFLPASTNWANVVNERIRAFAVPCTFQPGCAYPEVSDACTIQITGLNGFKLNNGTSTVDFGFQSPVTSPSLSDGVKVSPGARAWGGNEGPLAWRATAVNAQTNSAFTYGFAGTKAFPLTLASSPSTNSVTGALTWPPAKMNSLILPNSVTATVSIVDANGNTLQSFALNFPSTGFAIPNPIAEYSQDGSGNNVMPSYYMTLKNRVLLTGTNREFLIQPGDVSRSVEAFTDLRVIAGLTNVPSSMFQQHLLYKTIGSQHAHNLHFEDGTAVYGASGSNTLFVSATYPSATIPVAWTNWCNNTATNYPWPISPPCSCPTTTSANFVTMNPGPGWNGDWDTGPGFAPDGAQINLPDSGTTNAPAAAYFSLTNGSVGAPTQRTPNALVPSPVIFGSLPAGINPSTPTNSVPWCTLLFCPYPAANTSSTPYAVHPGAASPPDHLILDNFWMPVVEPYAVSTCMATAGKINLNDQIAPFTYLHRNTALHALLDSLRIPAIPVSAATTYKTSGTPLTSIWNAVDENATIAQIENRFANNSADAYLSESEICTVPIVPAGLVPPGTSVAATQTALYSYWNGYGNTLGGLTGDNLRELPYSQLYGRLTTRSNSYTVHVRVQVLQKLPRDPHQGVWNEGVDLVLGDWRGSYEIERYLDPAAPAPGVGQPLTAYKFRIISSRRFAP